VQIADCQALAELPARSIATFVQLAADPRC
jgi:hypothetical protein